jgi:hypothetical protein
VILSHRTALATIFGILPEFLLTNSAMPDTILLRSTNSVTNGVQKMKTQAHRDCLTAMAILTAKLTTFRGKLPADGIGPMVDAELELLANVLRAAESTLRLEQVASAVNFA